MGGCNSCLLSKNITELSLPLEIEDIDLKILEKSGKPKFQSTSENKDVINDANNQYSDTSSIIPRLINEPTKALIKPSISDRNQYKETTEEDVPFNIERPDYKKTQENKSKAEDQIIEHNSQDIQSVVH